MASKPYQIKQLHQLLQRYRDTPLDIYRYVYDLPEPISHTGGNTIITFRSSITGDVVPFIYDRLSIDSEITDGMVFYTDLTIDKVDKTSLAELMNRQLSFYLDQEDIDKFDINPDGSISVSLVPTCFTYIGRCRFRIEDLSQAPIPIETPVKDLSVSYLVGVRYGDYSINPTQSLSIHPIDGLLPLDKTVFPNALNITRWVVDHSIHTTYGLYLFGDFTADWYLDTGTYTNTNIMGIRLDSELVVKELLLLPFGTDQILGVKSYEDEILFYLSPPYRIEVYDKTMTPIESVGLTDPVYDTAVDFDDRSIVYATIPTNTSPLSFYYAFGHSGYGLGSFDRTLLLRYDRETGNTYVITSLSTRSRTDCYYIVDVVIDRDTVYCYLSDQTYFTNTKDEVLTINDQDIIPPDKAGGDFLQVLGVTMTGRIVHNPYIHSLYTDYLDVQAYKTSHLPYGYQEAINRSIIRYKDRSYLISRLHHPTTYIPGIGIYRVDDDGHVAIMDRPYPDTLETCLDSILVGKQWILSGSVRTPYHRTVPAIVSCDLELSYIRHFIEVSDPIDRLHWV